MHSISLMMKRTECMEPDAVIRVAHDIVERRAAEDDHIAYAKSVSNETEGSILETACAFANNYMSAEIGLLLIGIEKEGDSVSGQRAVPARPITGLDEAAIGTFEDELHSLLAHVHPQPMCHLLHDTIDGRAYCILAVEPGVDGPYEIHADVEEDAAIGWKAGTYIRVRGESRKPSMREELELLKRFLDVHFTSEVHEYATLDDLSYEYMRQYLVRTNAAQDVRAVSKLEMARSWGLISEGEDGVCRAKNFAVLMFADRPADFIPHAYVQVIREVVGTDIMEGKVFDGPIWMQAQQVTRYFNERIHATHAIRDPRTKVIHVVDNWPPTMFAELATNCILHKEYANRACVEIALYKDHISFVNHNRPLPPVKIADLNTKTEFEDRRYLNGELRDMFSRLGLAHSDGSGIRRAKDVLERIGSPALVFEPANEIDDYTAVVASINGEFARVRAGEERPWSIKRPINEMV